MSTVAEEIELLERVLFRLGTADTDEQLQNAVLKFLAPVLLKITSNSESVRCKVMEILTHVNKRLRSRPLVQLPVEALLLQYQSNNDSSFLHNFSIIYITMGFPRLGVEKQSELTTTLLNCLEGKTESHQDKLLMLVLPLLGAIKIPEDAENRHRILGLSDKPSTKKQLITLLQDVLLLSYGVTSEGEVPPGMSSYSFKRVIANNWKAEELEHLKKGICRFICSGVFSDHDALPLLVIASADTRFSVATPAIAELSKISSSLDWTDPTLSAPLYTLFMGNGSKIAERKSSPCSSRVRQKILHYLLKSRDKGINTVRGVQVIFDACFSENSNQKCKVLALQFTENLVKDGPKELIKTFAKVILNGIVKLIGSTSNEPFDVQNAAYGAISQLARICPDVVNKDLQLVVSFFGNLIESPIELHTSIREALISIASAFRWDGNDKEKSLSSTKSFTPNQNQSLLLAMLAEHAESKINIVQNVASVYLTTCFPEYFVPARYLLLLIAGERTSIRESIISYLYGVSKKDHINYAYISSIDQMNDNQMMSNDEVNKLSPEQRRIILPNFKEIVNYVQEQVEKKKSSVQRHVYGKIVLPYSYETYTEILDYIRVCLWFSAGAQTTPGDPKAANKLAEFIHKNYVDNDPSNEIRKYLQLVVHVLKAKRGIIELTCLYDILNASPRKLAAQCSELMENFSVALKDVSENTRTLVAQVHGILLANEPTDKDFNDQVKDIIISLPQRSLEHRHGSILALAHGFHRKIKFMKSSPTFSDKNIEDWAELKQIIELLASLITVEQPLLISAAIKGISLIASVTYLPIPNGGSSTTPQILDYGANEKMDIDGESMSTTKYTKTYVVQKVFRLMKNENSRAKIREDAALCLGYLAIGDSLTFVAGNLKGFLSIIAVKKNEALNIAIAQAIVYTVAGCDETILNETTVNDAPKINPHCDDIRLTNLLNDIIKMVPEPYPSSRISSAIWLLALVKNFSKRSPIYSRKQTLQYAFTELLSDDSEFVQDVASQGLGLVYALSDPNSQTDLANSLLDQLIGGKRQVKQVTAETEIFEEGVLGKTPMGGNITTYKELCSLASDLNQPEMIYQFMQLANHNSAWNSKLGAAFGLKSISKEAKQQMRPYLGKIVPRLYRYKYDPTPRIQNSMISIWDSIVTDSKEVCEQYYWDILDELITNLTHTEWRVRIACCLAVRDLIKRSSGLKLKHDENRSAAAIGNIAAGTSSSSQMDVDSNNAQEEVIKMETDDNEVSEPQLAQLWTQLFRVMDDVHEGTRLAAEGTTKVLSKVCVVAASSNNGKSGQAVASSILPLILETGVTSVLPEIRQISMKTLSEIIESSGSLLKPHLPTLVPCLLKATGELEIPKLSYLSTRLGAQVEAQEAVDSIRAEAAKQHHSMETLAKCIRYIDYNALELMTPQITDLMRTTVNLGSKVACAHFICLITVHLNKEMTPLAGKYLLACFNGLKDRNAIVRKYNATAIGHLVGTAKEQSIIRLFAKITEFYFENQSNKGIPQSIVAINKRHQEILKDYSLHILPLIFFAMHEEPNDDNQANVELWKELWLEVSPGDAGIRMNLDTIIPTLIQSLENPSWLLKAQSANAINTISTRLDASLPDSEREKLITAVLSNVSGRTFQGKERLLQALASLSKSLKKDDNTLYLQIIDATMKECRKEEPIYRTHALRAIGDILEQLKEDRFEEVYNMIWYLMDKKDLASVTGDDDDKDKTLSADERNKRAMIGINLKEAICLTLGQAWNIGTQNTGTQEKYSNLFVERCVECLQNNTRPVQLSLLVALGKFVDRLKLLNSPADMESDSMENNKEKKQKVEVNDGNLEKICKDILSAVVYVAGIPHTGLKKEALNIVFTLVKKLVDKGSQNELQLVRKTFADILETLQKDSAPEIKCRLKDIEDKLKTSN